MTKQDEAMAQEAVGAPNEEQDTAIEETESVAETAADVSEEAELSTSDASQEAEIVAEAAEVAEPEVVVEVEVAAEDESAESVEEVTATVDADANTDVDSGDAVGDDEDKKVVRMLAVGQQINGTVKRITEFGAFIDIGVGRDGLIHVSELSLQRVAKVSDVLSENQEILPWIKKLDRKRNRISLTLIDPEMKTIRDLKEGEIIKGTVSRILPYGAFIDIGIGRDALLHVREMSSKYVEKPEDVVTVGDEIETRIIEVSRRRGRVDLSLKGLIEEEEEEIAVDEVAGEEELEEEIDEFEDVEVLSPMELAFKKAVEAEGGEVRVEKKSGRKSSKRDSRAMQDEIIARTLDTRSK